MNVLIVKIGAIGDAIMALGALNWLKKTSPSIHVTWLAGEKIVPLLQSSNLADRIVSVKEENLFGRSRLKAFEAIFGIWKKLWRIKYDLIIIGHRDIRYRALITPVRCREIRILGDIKRGRQNPVPGRYHGDEYLRLLSGIDDSAMPPFTFPDIDVKAPEPEFQKILPFKKVEPWILLFPGSAKNHLREDPLRRWPIERYVELAEQLLSNRHKVILCGSPADLWVGEPFIGMGVVDLIGKTDFNHLMWVIAQSDVVVAHDSGPLHLALLLKRPLVALFGPTDPSEKIPRQKSSPVSLLCNGGEFSCSPCYDGKTYASCNKNICMESISAHEANQAVEQQLMVKKLSLFPL